MASNYLNNLVVLDGSFKEELGYQISRWWMMKIIKSTRKFYIT